jgi:hypothetical protein
MHLFSDELACLGRGRLPFACVLAGPLGGFLFWHRPAPSWIVSVQGDMSPLRDWTPGPERAVCWITLGAIGYQLSAISYQLSAISYQ